MAGRPAQPRVDLHITFDSVQQSTLEEIQAELLLLKESTMANQAELLAELAAANAATNNIAADIDDLQLRLSGRLTEAEAEEVRSQLATLSGRLQGIAADHVDNDPAPEPEPAPEPPVEP